MPGCARDRRRAGAGGAALRAPRAAPAAAPRARRVRCARRRRGLRAASCWRAGFRRAGPSRPLRRRPRARASRSRPRRPWRCRPCGSARRSATGSGWRAGSKPAAVAMAHAPGKRSARPAMPVASRNTGRPASARAATLRAMTSRGASSASGWIAGMKRWPRSSRSTAPAPRSASVRSGWGSPATASAVGWNCMNSRSASRTPRRAAAARPAPCELAGFVVRSKQAPIPPVASTDLRREHGEPRPVPAFEQDAGRARSRRDDVDQAESLEHADVGPAPHGSSERLHRPRRRCDRRPRARCGGGRGPPRGRARARRPRPGRSRRRSRAARRCAPARPRSRASRRRRSRGPRKPRACRRRAGPGASSAPIAAAMPPCASHDAPSPIGRAGDHDAAVERERRRESRDAAADHDGGRR